MNTSTRIAIDNWTFLTEVFRDQDEHEEIGVCAFRGDPGERDGKGWKVYRPYDSAVKRLVAPDGDPYSANTYFCISGLKPQDVLSRSAQGLGALYMVPLDDVGTGPGAKIKPELVPLAPSYAIETSEGNYQYGYFLQEPCGDLPTARALLKMLTKDHGDAGAPIAAKLIRLPQGMNGKTGRNNWKCRMVIWEPSRRFTIDQLQEAFTIDPAEMREEAQRLQHTAMNVSRGLVINDEVYDWLVKHNRVLAPPDDRGFVQIVCPWAHNHTDGNVEAAYSPLGCGGDYAGARQFRCLHGHCADKKTIEFMHQHFRERFVFVRQNGVIHDLLNDVSMTVPTFGSATANLWRWGGKEATVRIRYSIDWLMDSMRLTVNAFGFHPAQAKIYTDPFNGLLLNTFKPYSFPDVQTTEAALPIIAHLKYLFGEDLNHALGFIAWTVLRPETRIAHALLHIAPHHGTGRGWLKTLMAKLLQGYTQNPTLKELMEAQFNDFMWQSLLVTFDEIRGAGTRFKVQDRLREVITEPRLAVNIKHGFKGTTDVFANVIMLSNHMRPLDVPPEDRRIWPVVCPLPPKSEEYYSKLYSLLEEPATLWAFVKLLRQHLATFNPHARAPKNSWAGVVFGGDHDPTQEDLLALVTSLRGDDVHAIYRTHFIDLCRARNIELPYSEEGKAWARFNAIMGDLNVTRGERAVMSTSKIRAPMLIVAADQRNLLSNRIACKKECERVLLDERFTPRTYGMEE